MENMVRALARIDAIRALAPPPAAAPGFDAHLAAATSGHDHGHTAASTAAPAPAAAAVTLGQFVGVEAPAALAVVPPATPGGWVRPVDAEVGSKFGMRLHPILDIVRMHKGVDMGAPQGAPIRAVAPGVVSFAGEKSGYGNVVYVDHADGMQTRYAHQSELAVAEGQLVAAGQLIGFVGSTGLSTVPHLHFEVRRDGEAVDPEPYLART